MEPDDLLCSRNAHDRNVLVGRAQWEPKQTTLPEERAEVNYCATLDFDGSHKRHNRGSTPPGCSKSPSSKAAASKEAKRTLRYVEPLSDARTPLEDFFSILLEIVPGRHRFDLTRVAWASVDRAKMHDLFAFFPGDLRPVVRIGRIGQVFVFLELLPNGAD